MYSRLISLKNKFFDSLKFDKERKIRHHLFKINSNNENNFFDYGVGYFYQSSYSLNINGLRDSKFRKDIINIDNFTKKKRILDIGTNSGFLLLDLENNFHYALGVDYNPKLIEIANAAKNYLNITNIEFKVENFETVVINEKFDVILSLANHHTYDQGISSTKNYFEKITSLLNKDGILVLEGHHPQIESEKDFQEILDHLSSKYEIIDKKKYNINNFFDNGRNLTILKKTTSPMK
tara:strand:- start:170 stop:877 length:708 start_codon:yes stop_codon:yes gene_type:complete